MSDFYGSCMQKSIGKGFFQTQMNTIVIGPYRQAQQSVSHFEIGKTTSLTLINHY